VWNLWPTRLCGDTSNYLAESGKSISCAAKVLVWELVSRTPTILVEDLSKSMVPLGVTNTPHSQQK
jgi:hypothetical protein